MKSRSVMSAILVISCGLLMFHSYLVMTNSNDSLSERADMLSSINARRDSSTASIISVNKNSTRPSLTLTISKISSSEIHNSLTGRQDPIRVMKTENITAHFVCSSDCSGYQRWQVLAQIYSMIDVAQPGKYTWIISGCDKIGESKTREAIRLHNLAIEPLLYFTPDFSNMSVYGGPFASGERPRTFRNRHGNVVKSPYGNKYMFNNKPRGLAHWATDAGPVKNEAIILIDPDFLFLAPFQLPEAAPRNLSASQRKAVQGTGLFGPGLPAAQQYGLGDQWLSFNLSHICGPQSQCSKTTSKEVYSYYSAGPPYVIASEDVLPLAIEWSRLVPATYDEYPMLYAEMFAYSMAAANLDLRHSLLRQLMTGCMVGWPKVNKTLLSASATLFSAAENTASLAGASSCFLPGFNPPPFLHYCQHYQHNGFMFGKRNVHHDVIECTAPSFKPRRVTEPGQVDHSTGARHSPSTLQWNSLAFCAATRAIDRIRSSCVS